MNDEKKQKNALPFFLRTDSYQPAHPSPEREEELKALLRLVVEKRKEHDRQQEKKVSE